MEKTHNRKHPKSGAPITITSTQKAEGFYARSYCGHSDYPGGFISAGPNKTRAVAVTGVFRKAVAAKLVPVPAPAQLTALAATSADRGPREHEVVHPGTRAKVKATTEGMEGSYHVTCEEAPPNFPDGVAVAGTYKTRETALAAAVRQLALTAFDPNPYDPLGDASVATPAKAKAKAKAKRAPKGTATTPKAPKAMGLIETIMRTLGRPQGASKAEALAILAEKFPLKADAIAAGKGPATTLAIHLTWWPKHGTPIAVTKDAARGTVYTIAKADLTAALAAKKS